MACPADRILDARCLGHGFATENWGEDSTACFVIPTLLPEVLGAALRNYLFIKITSLRIQNHEVAAVERRLAPELGPLTQPRSQVKAVLFSSSELTLLVDYRDTEGQGLSPSRN